MNLNQLQQGLEQAFYTEQHRIVFWYDAERSFSDEVQALKLNDVHILNMAEESSLAIKLKLELQDLHKQQAELSSFEEKLRHYADQRISLDLDDGVKVNYGKFGDLLAEVKAVTGEK